MERRIEKDILSSKFYKSRQRAEIMEQPLDFPFKMLEFYLSLNVSIFA